MALISAAEFKTWLPGLDSAGTSDDALITLVISALDGAIGTYLGYPATTTGGTPSAEDATYTLYVAGRGGRDLSLPVYPIVSITSIEDDPTEAFDGASYLVASSDYGTAAPLLNRGIVRLTTTSVHGAWSSTVDTTGYEQIKAVVVAGYATVPEWLKQACKLWVQHVWMLRGAQGLRTAEGQSFRDETMPDAVRQLLAPHRLWSVLLG